MDEQQKIRVTFINSLWVTEFGGFYFGGRTLAKLIETLGATFPKEVLVFAIDWKSVEGNATAEQEVLKAGGAIERGDEPWPH
jgi:hypothetical protein